VPHAILLFAWILWFILTKVFQFDEVLEGIKAARERIALKLETELLRRAALKEAAAAGAEAAAGGGGGAETAEKGDADAVKKSDAKEENGASGAKAGDAEQAGADTSPSGDDAAGTLVTEGGAPSSTVDDANLRAPAPPRRGSVESVVNDDLEPWHAIGFTHSGLPAPLRGGHTGHVGGGDGDDSQDAAASTVAAGGAEGGSGCQGRHDFAVSEQACLSPAAVARLEFRYRAEWRLGAAAPSASGGGGADADTRGEKEYLRAWRRASGSTKLDRFFEAWNETCKTTTVAPTAELAADLADDDAANTAAKAAPDITMDREFRNKWLTRCEMVRGLLPMPAPGGGDCSISGGGDDAGPMAADLRGVEGNPDFLWCLPTDLITKHLNQRVLRPDMLGLLAAELRFREENPKMFERVDRRLVGMVSGIKMLSQPVGYHPPSILFCLADCLILLPMRDYIKLSLSRA